MKRDKETTTVEVSVSRFSSETEITIVIEVPPEHDHGKTKIYVTMSPADFALALTGRGGITGEMCVSEFPKAARK